MGRPAATAPQPGAVIVLSGHPGHPGYPGWPLLVHEAYTFTVSRSS
jgi:hypothetical protein